MEITSFKFVFLTIVSFFVFYLLPARYRIGFLVLLSCAFIASLSVFLLIYVLFYALINYYIGLKIPGSDHKLALFRTGLIINISQIVVLKYASFTIDPVIHLFNGNLNVSTLAKIIIPVGISFFTLQGIGYLVNIKMGWEKPEKNFRDFLLYISFFPKFISGPVERSNHFLPQIKAITIFDEQRIISGLRIALFGLFKKVAIANQLAPFVTTTYANLNSTDGSSLWILFFIQPLYLYFDFSGYTDIAIGLSRTFGIELLPNFDRPFLSQNVSTFWKRFHMSLSSWFNDYVFKQTMFKYRRWGIHSSTFAVFVTFLFFGIWHGAGWNFLILGLLQAIAINFEYFTKKFRLRIFSAFPEVIRVWIGRLITYIFYAGSLIFFFSDDLSSVFIFVSGLFKFSASGFILENILKAIPLSVLVFTLIFFLFELIKTDFNYTFNRIESYWFLDRRMNRIFRWAIYSSIISILFVLNNNVHQFIYSQF